MQGLLGYREDWCWCPERYPSSFCRLNREGSKQYVGSALSDNDAGSMVLPVVTRGITDASAMRRFRTPYT
jgi:hypothetical protein